MIQEIYNEFLSEIPALMGEEEFTLLIDNTRAHNNCQDIHHFKMLPKYSPFLNLTELANSAVKAS